MSYRIISPFILIAFCWNCAQQGSPTGGPRDEDPPVVLESIPANYSTRFEAKKIHITFDEYIVLDNVNQELVVSPPMEEKPEVKLRKKTLIIEFEEELLDSTTYTFNFGSAIKDLHEGNKLLNYEYVFSTGDVLDSLSVRGTLKYAENLTVPEEPITIMLYRELGDSVPITNIPLYVGRSDDSGVFSVNNLRPDIYKVFALKDGNYNLLFDLPTEEIGFLDSSLIVNAELARSLLEETDTTAFHVDTIAPVPNGETPVTDTTVSDVEQDSIKRGGPDYSSIYIDMLMFTEEMETQYITNDLRDDPRLIQVTFARPLTDSFNYRFLGAEQGDRVEVLELFSTRRDSLSLWLRDSLDYRNDTLVMALNYTVKDTAHRYVTQSDTLLFTYREKRSKGESKKPKEEKEEKLTITTIRAGGEQDLNRSLKLDLPLPLKAFTDSLVMLYHIPDSVEIAVPFKIHPDTAMPTRGWIDVEWESFSKYRLLLLPGAVSSIYDLDHDTLDISFKTRDIEYYGQILMTLDHVHNPVIIQLLNKEKVVRQQTVTSDGVYAFSYLVPQDYRIKFIHDLNGNGRWDTGKYLRKLQPEPVEFVPKTITVRSNWDHDVTISLEK
ncbi:MAG: Ig-like domain-containing protein [Bacteroidota bacterium]